MVFIPLLNGLAAVAMAGISVLVILVVVFNDAQQGDVLPANLAAISRLALGLPLFTSAENISEMRFPASG